MRTIPAPAFAARLARECRSAAAALAALQDGLGQEVAVATQAVLVREMQALDGVHQTLADLALLFDGLAGARGADDVEVPAHVTALVRQHALQARLRGRESERADGAVDLF